MHNTPPSSSAGKKTKGLIPEEDRNCEVCIVCDCSILEPSESTEGQDAFKGGFIVYVLVCHILP